MRNHLRLLCYARNHRATLLLILVLTIPSSGIVALQPWPIKLLIDQVLEHHALPPLLENGLRALSLGTSGPMLLGVVVFGGLTLFFLSTAIDMALAWIWTMVGRRLVYDVA